MSERLLMGYTLNQWEEIAHFWRLAHDYKLPAATRGNGLEMLSCWREHHDEPPLDFHFETAYSTVNREWARELFGEYPMTIAATTFGIAVARPERIVAISIA